MKTPDQPSQSNPGTPRSAGAGRRTTSGPSKAKGGGWPTRKKTTSNEASSAWLSSAVDDGYNSLNSESSRGTRHAATDKLKQFKPLPVIGRWPIRRQTTVTLTGLVVFAVAMLGNVWLSLNDVSVLKSQTDAVRNLGLLFRETPNVVQRSLVGDDAAFAQMHATVPALTQNAQALNNQPVPGTQAARAALIKNLNDTQAYLGAILKQEGALRRVAQESQELVSQNVQTIASAEPVMAALMQANAPQSQQVYFAHALTLFERLSKNLTALLVQNDQINAQALVGLRSDSQELQGLLQAFIVGAQNMPAVGDPAIRAQVQNLAALYGTMLPKINDLVSTLGTLGSVRAVGRPIAQIANQAERNLAVIEDAYNATTADHVQRTGLSVLLGLMTLLWAVLLTAVLSKYNTFQRLRAEADNEQIDAAIGQMTLDLDQIARGDLTRRATVVEVNVGTLADSLNHTVGDLANLVRTVKHTAQATARASQDAMEATNMLIETSRRQSQGVVEGGQEILKLTSSVDEVSRKSLEAAQVARASQEASRRGSAAIESSQQSMLTIRERVEEAENRVKRLTESSEEIGGIVTVMTDLAEQTEVLAVNAAVQAAKAGDAGKGFKVVADGVRELAEKSGAFSRRVGALVEAALADIKATLVAVQRATQETDEGARLTDITNDALMTIGEVSDRLAELISEITQQTTEQARTANFLSENTQAALRVAEESKQQTQNASEAIAQVDDVTRKLGQSIKGFTI